MYLIGLESCPGCKIFKEAHPELQYIEIPRSSEGDKKIQTVKKALNNLKIKSYPVILNSGMTGVIPLETIDKKLAPRK